MCARLLPTAGPHPPFPLCSRSLPSATELQHTGFVDLFYLFILTEKDEDDLLSILGCIQQPVDV